MSDFGDILRELREKRGLSVNQLGLYSEVSPSSISKIENKLRKPKSDTIKKLARGLKMDYAELMYMAGHMKPIDKIVAASEQNQEISPETKKLLITFQEIVHKHNY